MYHLKYDQNRVLSFAAVFSAVVLVAATIIAISHPFGLALTSQADVAPASEANANVPLTAQHMQDLGGGYWLQTGPQGGKIIPPSSVVPPSTSTQTLDIGGGYTLSLNSPGGQIIAPVRAPASVRKMDLGAGYVLELSAYGGEIIPPPSMYKGQPPASILKKVDLGAGYTLELSANGGQIVAPSHPGNVQPNLVKKTELGGGYWLENGPGGWQIVHE